MVLDFLFAVFSVLSGFKNHLAEEERELIVLLQLCFVSLPRGAMNWSVVFGPDHTDILFQSTIQHLPSPKSQCLSSMRFPLS